MKISELTEKITAKGNFSDLNIFDFQGVYILYDSNDEIVYIGSSYGRTIRKRLMQYLRVKDTGNSLGKSIQEDLQISKGNNSNVELEDAIEVIKKYNILAIEHHDLEYHLISKAEPKYNTIGKK